MTSKTDWQILVDEKEYGAAAKSWLKNIYGDSEYTSPDTLVSAIGDDGRPIGLSHAFVAIARYLGYAK